MSSTIKIPYLELQDLAPSPEDEWERLLRFVGLTPKDKKSMAYSTETLL